MPAQQIGRNDPCPCGSGKKHKRCCLGKPTTAAPTGAGGKPPPVRDLLRRAEAARGAGQIGVAIQTYRQVVQQHPKHAEAHAALGQVLGQVGFLEQGITHLRRSIELNERQPQNLVHLAALLVESGQADEASAAATRAVALRPDDVWIRSTLAALYGRINRMDDAFEHARAAVRAEPANPLAAVVLAGLEVRGGEPEAARERLAAVVADATVQGQLRQRAMLHLATALEKLGVYDEAFDAFSEMGRITRTDPLARALDPGEWERLIDAYRAGLTRPLLERWGPDSFGDGLPAPSFLVGHPRSGTTMTEQVLAAHPKVVTSDERQFIAPIKQQLGLREQPVATLEKLGLDAARGARRQYWELVEADLGEPVGDRTFIDKLPLNLVDLGLINVLFPGATILVALRDPRDVCLSCFQQDFRINAAMMHYTSLDSTVAFYEKVMDLWLDLRELTTLPCLEVRYEDTVTDLEPQARRILEALQLDWDPSLLSFHERARERAISTPSFAAVTEKVHTRAIGRWRNYQKQFEPHQPKLARFVEAFGYGEKAES